MCIRDRHQGGWTCCRPDEDPVQPSAIGARGEHRRYRGGREREPDRQRESGCLGTWRQTRSRTAGHPPGETSSKTQARESAQDEQPDQGRRLGGAGLVDEVVHLSLIHI